MSLCRHIPDAELLVALPPEEVGKHLLKVCNERAQNGIFQLDSVAGEEALFGGGWDPRNDPYYPRTRASEIELAAAEAFQWLENSLLLIPARSPNNSFWRISRMGQALLGDETRFGQFLAASRFPKSLIHPSVADEVWLQLAQGNFAVAVFIAFRAVEEAVRDAAGYALTEHGVPMARRAFHKDNGPLTDLGSPEAEREALASLFAGALGSYKNPHSHRTVEIIEPAEAQEMVVLASHLLRIVDARRGA